jgi:hypothetical protein
MVLRRHRGRRRREEDGGDQWRTPARLGGRRTEHLEHDATLDISLWLRFATRPFAGQRPVGEDDDDVGGRRRAAPRRPISCDGRGSATLAYLGKTANPPYLSKQLPVKILFRILCFFPSVKAPTLFYILKKFVSNGSC